MGMSEHPESTPEDELVMQLLREHVPLTLLADLATPEGPPPSTEILREEGLPEDPWWQAGR